MGALVGWVPGETARAAAKNKELWKRSREPRVNREGQAEGEVYTHSVWVPQENNSSEKQIFPVPRFKEQTT